MMRFSSTVLSRDEFLDWVGGSSTALSPSPRGDSRVLTEGQQVTLLLDGTGERSGTQPIVAIPIDEMDEFFAFAATYIATWKPYSAFYHVVPLELADAVEGRRPLDATRIASFARLVAGAARAEAFLASRSRSGISFGSALATANATLSAVLGAAAIAGYSPTTMSWIAGQWASLRSGTHRHASLPEAVGAVSSIWQLLFSAARNERDETNHSSNRSAATVSDFVQVALKDGVTSELLRKLGHGLPNHTDLAEMLTASREERILSFNRFVANMGEGISDGLEGPFMAGLLLAIVGNGSFEMLRSARELAERSPHAITWFGICAALFEGSNVLTGANCLGRRITRDLDRPRNPFDLPQADLGVFEYWVMSRDATALEQVNVSSADAFCIEILPDVVTYVPRGSTSGESRSLEDYRLLAESFREIRYVVDRVARRLNRSAEPRQRDMYGDETKSRKRSR